MKKSHSSKEAVKVNYKKENIRSIQVLCWVKVLPVTAVSTGDDASKSYCIINSSNIKSFRNSFLFGSLIVLLNVVQWVVIVLDYGVMICFGYLVNFGQNDGTARAVYESNFITLLLAINVGQTKEYFNDTFIADDVIVDDSNYNKYRNTVIAVDYKNRNIIIKSTELLLCDVRKVYSSIIHVNDDTYRHLYMNDVQFCMTLFNLYIYSYANIKLQNCLQKVLRGDIKVKCVCWLWSTSGYINDGVEQLQCTVHSHYTCVTIGLKWNRKVIIFDPVRSKMVRKRYYDRSGWWLLVAAELMLLWLLSFECEDVQKRVVSWVVIKVVIKGLLSDYG
jgi:hypothetical protein